jgi:hypothetical protein
MSLTVSNQHVSAMTAAVHAAYREAIAAALGVATEQVTGLTFVQDGAAVVAAYVVVPPAGASAAAAAAAMSTIQQATGHNQGHTFAQDVSTRVVTAAMNAGASIAPPVIAVTGAAAVVTPSPTAHPTPAPTPAGTSAPTPAPTPFAVLPISVKITNQPLSGVTQTVRDVYRRSLAKVCGVTTDQITDLTFTASGAELIVSFVVMSFTVTPGEGSSQLAASLELASVMAKATKNGGADFESERSSNVGAEAAEVVTAHAEAG